jgi:hypothetical protein
MLFYYMILNIPFPLTVKDYLDRAKDDFKQKWDKPASVGYL